jgi:hypothetical protein
MVMREAVSEPGFGLSVGFEMCRRVSKEQASFCSSISLLRFRHAGSGSDLRIAEIASNVPYMDWRICDGLCRLRFFQDWLREG